MSESEVGMRLNGEIEEEEVEVVEEKKLVVVAETYSIGVGFPQPLHKLKVGYALTSKKKNSFLQPKFLALARLIPSILQHSNVYIYVFVCVFGVEGFYLLTEFPLYG